MGWRPRFVRFNPPPLGELACSISKTPNPTQGGRNQGPQHHHPENRAPVETKDLRSGSPIKSYLTDVFNSVILKDIAKRHKVRDIDLLERILSYIVSEVGHIFSSKSVIKYLKHGNRTVALEPLYNFLKYANASSLHSPASPTTTRNTSSQWMSSTSPMMASSTCRSTTTFSPHNSRSVTIPIAKAQTI